MPLFFFPLFGILTGFVGGMTGTGAGVVAVPLLLSLGFSKDAALGTTFLNMLFVVAGSFVVHGTKGNIDWKIGLAMGIGSFVTAAAVAYFLQPHISEKTFRIVFAIFLIIVAITMLLKK